MYVAGVAVLSLFLLSWCSVNGGVVVKTQSGLIEGTTGVSHGGRQFDVFFGIPYAAPPVGKLRLKSPKEPTPWEGVRQTAEKGIMCVQPLQYGVVDTPAKGQEDCLYLNVFTPNASNPNTKLPVIVYIHGGAFQSADASMYSPEYILDRDVIYVSPNYRLGPLGFLSMSNDVIPGNFGFKDQTMALKWVKNNIAAFGGNPKDVTIMGESAGASSVHFHFFSPLSKGLFHKAIFMSGSAFALWTHYTEDHTKALGTAFAVATGCYYEDPHAVLTCLQNISTKEFVKKESHLYIWGSEPTVLFKPAIEKNTKNAFLPHEPTKYTYVTKNIPILTGITSGEGGFKIAQYFGGNGESGKTILEYFDRFLPLLLQYKYTADPDSITEITEAIKNFYFPQKNNPDWDLKLADAFTDSMFAYSFVDVINTIQGPRYAYLYDHRANYSSQTSFGSYPKDLGVCHEDDLSLVMYRHSVDSILTPADKAVSARLINYLVNFATYGDPNGLAEEKLWKPVSSEAVEYLHIRTESDVMESNLWEDRINFWHSLPLGRNSI